mgnify:CR=1 FL=1
MKELAIGEEIRIRCVEGTVHNCQDCIFLENALLADLVNCSLIPCRETERKDGKNVHFELVED